VFGDTVAIVNTQAGAGITRWQLAHFVRQLSRILSVSKSRIWLTEKAGENSAQSLASLAQERGAKAIVVFGGDGTFHQVVNGLQLPDPSISIGIVPCGTANVVASCLKMPRNVKAALEIIRTGRTREIDLGILEGDNLPRYTVFTVSVGFDALINQLAHQKKPKLRQYHLPSILAYIPPLWRYTFERIPIYDVTVTKDGEVFKETISFLAVVNTPHYGAGLVDRFARLDDGLFSLLCARELRSRDLPWWMFQMWQGNLIYYPKVFLLCSSLATFRITSDSLLPTQVDGEVVAGQKNIAISVFPRALRVFTPLS
jgi:YegS/Rv2252/BmrU family lipid kinase